MRLIEIKKGQFNDDTKCLYRLHNVVNNYNYIGMAFSGINVRLFGRYGYNVIYSWMKNNNYKIYESSPDILLNINEAIFKYGLENFELFQYDDVYSLTEEILISEYNSVLNGYNKTLDGLNSNETKYKTSYFTDGYSNARLPIVLSDKILEIEGIRQGMTHHVTPEHGPNLNRIWITDGNKDYIIPELEYDQYDKNKWKRGRSSVIKDIKKVIKPEDKVKIPSKMNGKKTMNNGINEIKVDPNKIEYYLSLGYVLGGLKNKNHSTTKGKIHVYNDLGNKLINPDELDHYLSLNYKLGMKPKN